MHMRTAVRPETCTYELLNNAYCYCCGDFTHKQRRQGAKYRMSCGWDVEAECGRGRQLPPRVTGPIRDLNFLMVLSSQRIRYVT